MGDVRFDDVSAPQSAAAVATAVFAAGTALALSDDSSLLPGTFNNSSASSESASIAAMRSSIGSRGRGGCDTGFNGGCDCICDCNAGSNGSGERGALPRSHCDAGADDEGDMETRVEFEEFFWCG